MTSVAGMSANERAVILCGTFLAIIGVAWALGSAESHPPILYAYAIRPGSEWQERLLGNCF